MRNLTSPLLAAALFAAGGAAQATLAVDTGTPGGSVIGALALDGNDFVAGQFTLAQAASVQSLATHLLGTTAGETFTLALYADSAAHKPGALLFSATATAGGDGWNGVSGLSGWTLASGSYWVGIEVDPGDTLGSGSITGALLDVGAPSPLARTAFSAGSGWQVTAQPLAFGLRVDVSPVPEPAVWLLGLAGVAALALRRGLPMR
jgi:hypothetical protein